MVFSKVALSNVHCSRNRAKKFHTFYDGLIGTYVLMTAYKKFDDQPVYLKNDTPLVNYAKDLHISPLPRNTVDKGYRLFAVQRILKPQALYPLFAFGL